MTPDWTAFTPWPALSGGAFIGLGVLELAERRRMASTAATPGPKAA